MEIVNDNYVHPSIRIKGAFARLYQRLKESRLFGLSLYVDIAAKAQDDQEVKDAEILRENRECITLLDEAKKDGVITMDEMLPIEQRLREMEIEQVEGRPIKDGTLVF